jgi:hypothetical protein
MLRLVQFLLYLIGSSTVPQSDFGVGVDPLGLAAPPPSDFGAGADPLG